MVLFSLGSIIAGTFPSMGTSELLGFTMGFCLNWVATVSTSAQVMPWTSEIPSGWRHVPDKCARMHRGGEWKGRFVQMVRVVVWNAENRGTLHVDKGHPDQDSGAADAEVAKRLQHGPKREGRLRAWTRSKRARKELANQKGQGD